jgi:hypothetical protein
MTEADPWVIASAASSAAVAIFTGWLGWSTRGLASETKRLARETSELARDTVAATLAAERHHQEQMRPLVLLDASLTRRAERVRDSGHDYRFTLEGDLCNFGGGAATHIVLVVTPHSQTPQEFSLGVLGPNTRHPLANISWLSWSSQQGNEGGFWPFQTVLGYSTAGFSLKAGTTKQASVSGLAADLKLLQMTPTESEPPSV